MSSFTIPVVKIQTVGEYDAILKAQQTSPELRSHAATSDGQGGGGGGEEAVEGTKKKFVFAQNKRSREDGEEVNGGAKRQKQRRSEHEKRLTGDFAVPKTAKAITFQAPGENSTLASNTNSGTMSTGQRHRTSLRPMNTLDEPRHAATAKTPGTPHRLKGYLDAQPSQSDFFQGNEKPSKKAGQLGPAMGQSQAKLNSLETTKSRGSNVKQRRQVYGPGGEGFELDGERERTVKKRKTTHAEQVDLTSDAEPDEDAKEQINSSTKELADSEPLLWANVVEPQAKAWRTAKGMEDDNPLANAAYENGTAWTKPEPKRRKPKGQNQSSQASQTPSVVSISASEHNGPRAGPGSRQSPVEVAESQDSVHYTGQKPKGRRTISQTGTVSPTKTLPIDLDKGVFDKAQQKLERGSHADVRDAGEFLRADMQQRSAAQSTSQNRVHQRQLRDQQRAAEPERPRTRDISSSVEPYSMQWYANQGRQHNGSQSPRLAHTFHRDESSAPSTKPALPKRHQQMVADSRHVKREVSPIRESFGSDDVLAGETTIGSKSSQSASPVKQQPRTTKSRSPSDLPPSNLKSSQRQKTRQTAGSGPQKSSKQSDAFVIPILAFYSESCVLNEGQRYYLVYDGENNDLDVHDDNGVLNVPGVGCVVTLGKNEVHKIFYHPKSSRVHVTGSKTAISHGSICIAFENADGVKLFHDLMVCVTEEQVALIHLALEKLDNKFAHQAHIINQAHRLRMSKLAASRPALGRLTGYHGSAEEDEEIQYEPEEPPARPRRANGMLSGNDGSGNQAERTSRTGRQPKTSPYFEQNQPVRRSTRDRKPAVERERTPSPVRWTRVNKPKPWSHPVVYPPQGAKRVTVDFSDLERLDEGEFLNDNVISFALRRIEENMPSEQREKVHFFNSFFYTSLTTKNGKKTFNYDGVKKWTKNVDIFGKEGVVVPICIDLHWFVAIACNLDKLKRQPAGLEDEADAEGEAVEEVQGDAVVDIAQEEQGTLDDSVQITGSRATSEQPMKETEAMGKLSLEEQPPGARADQHASAEQSAAEDEGSIFEFGDNDEVIGAEGGNDERAAAEEKESRPSTATSSKNRNKKTAPPLRKLDPDTPAILTLDSFGSAHTAETRFLKDYLMREADEKRGMGIDRDQLKGLTAKGLPQQPNFCDCGVYLIGYVEKFAKDPEGFVRKVLSRELDQESDFADFDPSAKRDEIREVLLKLQVEQEEERRAAKKAKAEQRSGTNTPKSAQATATAATAKAATRQPPKEQTRTNGANNNEPDTKPGMQELLIERRKELSKSTRPTTDAGEEEHLETELPRPLPPSLANNKARGQVPTPSVTHNDASAPEDSQQDDGEMLDTETDAPGPVPSDARSTEAIPGSADDDPLSGLDEILTKENTQAAAAANCKRSAAIGPVSKHEHVNEPPEEQSARLTTEPCIIEVPDDSQPPAEIADSQEAAVSGPKITRTGRYIRFDGD